MKKALFSAATLSGTLVPALALAQRGDAPTAAATAAAAGAGAALFGGMIAFMLVIGALSIFFLVFWVMMLIDCLKREWPEKNTWVLVLVFSFLVQLHWLAALVYYFMIKKKDVGAMAASAPKTPPPAAPPAGS